MAIYPFRPHEKRHFCSNWEWTDFWNTLHPQIYDCKNHRPRFHWTHEINSFQHFDGTIGRLTIDGYSVFWDHFESDSNSKSSGVILTQCTRGLSNGNFIANPEEIQNVLLPRLDHGHLHTGQLSHHFFFWQATSMGANTWDPNYTPGVDFLDHDFFIILKNSHQDYYELNIYHFVT